MYSVPLSKFPDFHINVNEIISKATSTCSSIVFLGSPNNPTGRIVPETEIALLCDILKFHTLIVVDEAYIEFSDQPSCASLLDHYENLCVIRTFSKWAGLAGLRCGYLLGNRILIKKVLQV